MHSTISKLTSPPATGALRRPTYFDRAAPAVPELPQTPLGPAVVPERNAPVAKPAEGVLGGLGNALNARGPQSVGVLPVLSALMRHRSNPVRFFEEVHKSHGESVRLRLPDGRRVLFDITPEVVGAALRGTDVTRGMSSFEKSDVQGHGLSFLMGKENVFLGKGSARAPMQKAMAPHFNRAHVHGPMFFARIAEIVDARMADLEARVAGAGDRAEIDMNLELQGTTIEVALYALFGKRVDMAERWRIQDAFSTVMSWLATETMNPTEYSLSNLGALIPGAGRLRDAYDALTDFADGLIATNPEGVIGDLLRARDPSTGQPYPHPRVRDEVLTLLLAGHETTATLLSWAMVELSRHPAELAKVRSEVDRVIGSGAPTAEQLGELPHTKRVLDETLRLYSPAYFLVRGATEDVTAGATEIKKGTVLMMSMFHHHRREAQWGVEKTGYAADEFAPERWSPESQKKHGLEPEDMRTYPFGFGTRICLGMHMAKLEATLILARMVQRFELRHDGREVELASDIAVRPSDATVGLSRR